MKTYYKIYMVNGIWDDFCHLQIDATNEKKFRHCSAKVGTTMNGEFTYLRSYNTIVCVRDNITGEAVDVLRTECGYTNTSCMHVSKFLQDYRCMRLYRTDIDENGMYYKRIF